MGIWSAVSGSVKSMILVHFGFPLARTISPIFSSRCLDRIKFSSMNAANSNGSHDNVRLIDDKKRANFRLCNVAGFKTDLVEIRSPNPAFHVLFIPGNPGVVSFYTVFLESLYELLGGKATVIAIGHVAHTQKNWEHGRLFSLQEQIDHKMSFIQQELEDGELPIILVGHSIGAHISVEMFKRSQEKVRYCVCLYPFLAVNTKSTTQSLIRKLAASPLLCAAISSIVALFGMIPIRASRFLIKYSMGKLWSSAAVDALCTHVLQYHSMRNVLYMAMTEFRELSGTPDWDFIRNKRSRFSFLFGLDDHWGPLHLSEEISKQVSDAAIEIERKGHTHAFSCTHAGAFWAAQRVSTWITSYLSNPSDT